jgi:hypothetical protein
VRSGRSAAEPGLVTDSWVSRACSTQVIPAARCAGRGTPKRSPSIYQDTNHKVALRFVTRLGHDLQDESCPERVDE